MIGRLDELDKKYKNRYYFQVTINKYGKEVEPNLLDIKKRIKTFHKISKKIAKERVIWRYDPILLNEKYSNKYHLDSFKYIAKNLKGYTDKVVISFIDLYMKTKRNTKSLNIEEISQDKIKEIAKGLKKIADNNAMEIETCAEKIDLSDIGINHGACIDKKLIEQIIGYEIKVSKDNSRNECECFKSVEVGTYDTCLNGCKYCYATLNTRKANHDSESPFFML
jgi:DNA repair photolyase